MLEIMDFSIALFCLLMVFFLSEDLNGSYFWEGFPVPLITVERVYAKNEQRKER
jgi:hypothetical protein